MEPTHEEITLYVSAHQSVHRMLLKQLDHIEHDLSVSVERLKGVRTAVYDLIAAFDAYKDETK